MRDYDKICDFNNLYKAHMSARHNKRDKRDVIQFEMHLSENLVRISRELKNKTYRMSGYYSFTIYEPKERLIYAANYIDRVVLHCVCDEVLSERLGKKLIYDNAACQKGKGTHFALDRFSKFLSEHYKAHGLEGYILKCDVRKYFASIDHEVLKVLLRKAVKDSDLLQLLYHYIDSYETEGKPGKGLPLGNQSSQWFAIYYLNPLDRLIKEKLGIKYYIRYMDDLVIIHHDKEYLKFCLSQMTNLLESELKLEFNEKTQIKSIKKSVTFLGWNFSLSKTGKVSRRLKTQSKVRFKRKIRKLKKDYECGAIDLADVKNSIASYKGHLKHGNTYFLRKKVFDSFVLRRKIDDK